MKNFNEQLAEFESDQHKRTRQCLNVNKSLL